MAKKMQTMDGNTAAAHISYAFTEVASIYPITPSSPMAELTDVWAANGRKNVFGEIVKLIEMQSEGGAAGAMHGSLQAGALSTTYTASQGLLLMIPNMYKIAAELLPGVFHVSARTLSAHALSIFGDHGDVYSALQTGCAMLASGSVQEVMDLGAVAHLAAIESKIPFVHFFDGFRTSHEIQKIEVIDYEDLKGLINYEKIDEFRKNSINPEHPLTKGTAQNQDVFFQAREACNKYYDALPDIVAKEMEKISKITGRDYKPFNYYGATDAEYVLVAMGSLTDTIKETVNYFNKKGEKYGAISVHLLRPFSDKYFLNVLPKSVKKIGVIDRVKECGAPGETLYLNIKHIFADREVRPIVIGGRAGLSSKDTVPADIAAAFLNLKSENPKKDFTLAINDDVTFKSLARTEKIDTVPVGTIECKFYGLGSDGTVGANKNSIKIIGDNTDKYAQGYFAYDSKKSGGITISHLRFGKSPITATYLITNPAFVSCSMESYIEKYDMLDGIKEKGIFLLNTVMEKDEIINAIPDSMKKVLAEKNIDFYIINATKIAAEIGLGNRTNTIMQSAFFKLTNVIEYSHAVELMKTAIKKSYGKKGDKIVNMNYEAVDKGSDALVKIDIDPLWKNLSDNKISTCAKTEKLQDKDLKLFVDEIVEKVNSLKGDDLPVSAFMNAVDGSIPNGSSAYEKRGVAVNVPEWQIDKCIQCNQCSYICPHAAIRPFLINSDEKAKVSDIPTKKAMGKDLADYEYRLQVTPLDCAGCGSCANVCPVNALDMKPIASQRHEAENYEKIISNVTYKENLFNKNTVKGSQFCQPLFEFSGACAGCGETPYVKLITQLFGDRMLIGNATGCSSIYGGSYPASPYCKNHEGKGPAWASSLFEDNAEYALGMLLGVNKIREKISEKMKDAFEYVTVDTRKIFTRWLDNIKDADITKEINNDLIKALESETCKQAKDILKYKDQFIKKSVWAFGGDGWAFDIGFGGVDHVLASGEDINMLVMDTEIYSNTGGQASKATPSGAVAKFAATGKPIRKKDLARMMMTYGYVYVAHVAMGANQSHYLKVIKEAESYPGPSLVIAYAPCINHGLKGGMGKSQMEEKFAVEVGYWHLFRYNPLLEKEGKNPFCLDSKEPDWSRYMDFLKNEVRYTSLIKTFPEEAEKLFAQSLEDAKRRHQIYKTLSEVKL